MEQGGKAEKEGIRERKLKRKIERNGEKEGKT